MDINRDSGGIRLHPGHPFVAQNQGAHAQPDHTGLSQSAGCRLHATLLTLLYDDVFLSTTDYRLSPPLSLKFRASSSLTHCPGPLSFLSLHCTFVQLSGTRNCSVSTHTHVYIYKIKKIILFCPDSFECEYLLQ